MKPATVTTIKTTSGFTLIELMIVVAIIGIISTFAYSSYQDSVRKSKRAEGKTVLAGLAQGMERCYTANSAYDVACSVHDGAALRNGGTPNGYYNVAIGNLTATTFTLTATAAFVDAECTTFTINEIGQKTSADDGGVASACW